MNYTFKASENFWKSFHRLSNAQKAHARAAWQIFKRNPFDPQLGTHKIQRLSAVHGKTVYAVRIEADLRAVFSVEGDLVFTIDIGTHALYRT